MKKLFFIIFTDLETLKKIFHCYIYIYIIYKIKNTEYLEIELKKHNQCSILISLFYSFIF